MTNNSYDIGYCFIERATLSRYAEDLVPFSISNYISTISFVESIHSSILTGEITIVDTSGLLDNYPLLGEEILTLTYIDFFETRIDQQFIIYSMSEAISNPQQNMMYYKLKFVSPQHLMSISKLIRKSYTGQISEIVKNIFNEYLVDETKFKFSSNEIEVEETTGIETTVVPSMQPIQAIDFFKRRSYSADNKSSNYYFFQNRQKFKMVTHEKLIKDSRRGKSDFPRRNIYTYDPDLKAEDISNMKLAMNNLISFHLPKRFNTLEELNSGAMTIDVVEVDILNKQYLHNIHKYRDSFQEYTHLDDVVRFPHTEKFESDFFGEENVIKSEMIFKDSERPNQYYKEIIGPRSSNYYYLNSIQAKAEIYGRNDLFAGDVIQLDIFRNENLGGKQKELHKSLSGYWLINQIQHNIEGKQHKCILQLSKDLVLGDKLGSSVVSSLTY